MTAPASDVRCRSTWQGPSDESCTDDLLVIQCEGFAGHNGALHLARHPDDGAIVAWKRGTTCLASFSGGIRQHQFNPCPIHDEPTGSDRAEAFANHEYELGPR